jgi:hypothetical protein
VISKYVFSNLEVEELLEGDLELSEKRPTVEVINGKFKIAKS